MRRHRLDWRIWHGLWCTCGLPRRYGCADERAERETMLRYLPDVMRPVVVDVQATIGRRRW